MRYLENFVNYLNESAEDITDLSKEDDDGLTYLKNLFDSNEPIKWR
jgi:hypothetical protein